MTPQFKAALGLSIGLHAAALAGFSTAVTPAKFDVERAPSSLEIFVVAPPTPAPAQVEVEPAPSPIEPAAQPHPEPVKETVIIPEQKGALTEVLPGYLRNPAPVYPRLSRERGEQGPVVLETEVLASGRCGSIRVLRSSGYRRLDEAATSAIAQWRFEPARRAGQPVTVWVEIPVTFQLIR